MYEYQQSNRPAKNWHRRDRREDPPTTIYFLRESKPGSLFPIHCMYCTRVIIEAKGVIEKIMVNTPEDTTNFDKALNIRCKLCHQNYRLVDPRDYMHVEQTITVTEFLLG